MLEVLRDPWLAWEQRRGAVGDHYAALEVADLYKSVFGKPIEFPRDDG